MKPITGWVIVRKRKKTLTLREFIDAAQNGMVYFKERAAEEDILTIGSGNEEAVIGFAMSFKRKKKK